MPAPDGDYLIREWIVDSGAGYHLVPVQMVDPELICQSDRKVRVHTANGQVVITDRAWVPVPGLGISLECLVLPEGKSAAISLRRLVLQGFDVRWEDENPPGYHIPIVGIASSYGYTAEYP